MRGHAAARKCVHVCTSARATHANNSWSPTLGSRLLGRDRTVTLYLAEGFTGFVRSLQQHRQHTTRIQTDAESIQPMMHRFACNRCVCNSVSLVPV